MKYPTAASRKSQMAFSFSSCCCSLSRAQDRRQSMGEYGDNQVSSPALYVPKREITTLWGRGPSPKQIVEGLKLRVWRREDNFVGIHSPFLYPWKAFTS